MITFSRCAIVGLLFALGVLTAIVLAGPLDPPSGQVSPTYKTLTDVEPRNAISATSTPGDANSIFRITQSGSYYLTGNVLGQAGKHGIEVAISNVTIDLNGFSLNTFAVGLDGISTDDVDRTNVTVRNGKVTGWTGVGVRLMGTAHTVENVNVTVCGGHGIFVGTSCAIRGCQSNGNSVVGILAGQSSIITDCTASNNNSHGFSISESTISNCSAIGNGWRGINAGSGCIITACTATQSIGEGFLMGSGSTATNCLASDNVTTGFSMAGECMLLSSSARLNGSHGILCSSSCLIRGNTSTRNGTTAEGAGIRTSGSLNRIEDNTCSDNDRGIWGSGSPSVFIGNTCSSNSIANYTIAAGNRVGVIVVPPASGAIDGNGGAAGMGTTDPWANFAN